MGDRTSVVIAGRMGQLFALIIRRSQYSKNDPQTRCSYRKGRTKTRMWEERRERVRVAHVHGSHCN